MEFYKYMDRKNLNVMRDLFTIAILRNDIPQQWKEDRLTLIYKGKGSKEKLDNLTEAFQLETQ